MTVTLNRQVTKKIKLGLNEIYIGIKHNIHTELLWRGLLVVFDIYLAV